MATRDLSYVVNFDIEGAAELSTAATNMEELATAAGTIDETATLDLDLPAPSEIEDVGDAIGDIGADGGPIDTTNTKVGGLKSTFAEMVGAISLVQVATVGADFVMGKLAEQQEKLAKVDAFDDAQVQAFAEAIRQAGDDVTTLVDSLEGTQRITGIVEQTGDVIDITNDLANAGVTADQYFRVLEGGEPAFDAFLNSLEEQGVAEGTRNRIQLGGIANLRTLEEGTLNAAGSNAVFAESQESANQALQELLNDQNPMRAFNEEWDILRKGMRDGSIDTQTGADALNTLADGLNLTTDQVLELAQADLNEAAEGAQAFADALNSIEFDNTDLEGATSAFANYSAGLFAAGNETQRVEEAYAGVAAAIGDGALNLDVGTEAGRAQQDAFEELSGVVEGQLAQAYDDADGSLSTFMGTAGAIGVNTLQRLQDDLNLTSEQTEQLAQVLGLTADDYEARFHAAGVEEARLQLSLLGGAIEGLPDDIEVIVNQQILAGDYVGARDTVANYYAENPVPVPTEADTTGATEDIAAVEPEPVTIVADADTAEAADDLLDETSQLRTATINAEAETLFAGVALDVFTNQIRTAEIGTDANLTTAANELAGFVNQQRTATIDAAIGSVPSAQSFVNAIGPIRVPIQLYYNQRIEGNRPI